MASHPKVILKNIAFHLAIAALYLIFAKIGLVFAFQSPTITIFWPAGGFALAVVLLKGIKYLPALLIGAVAAGFIVHLTPWMATALAVANLVETYFAYCLITRYFRINLALESRQDFWKIAIVTATVTSSISALIGTTALLIGHIIPLNLYTQISLRWWMADVLGIAFLTPFILIWNKAPNKFIDKSQVLEVLILLCLTILIGLVVFFDWFKSYAYAPQGIAWIILLVAYSAFRFGKHITTILQLIVFSQALWSASHHTGHYAYDMVQSGLFNFWLFGMVSAVGGLTVAVMSDEATIAHRKLVSAMHYKRALLDNFPFMVWLKDTESRFLTVNKAFVYASGVQSSLDLIGKTDFDIYPHDLAKGYRSDDLEVMHHSQQKNIEEEVLDRGERKWFETYKAPIIDADGSILGTVGFARDITHRKQSEQQRIAHEIALRNTLVREVHHRIKNSLQGVTGLLRQTMVQHPELQEAVANVIGQIRSIAVIHGLQGSNQNSQVILQDIVTEIASNNLLLWHSTLVVDIQADLPAWQIIEEDTVPLALVVNELVLNAIKHSVAHAEVRIRLHTDNGQDAVLTISNFGKLSQNTSTPHTPDKGTGLALLDLLLPAQGANLSWEQSGELVLTRLVLTVPVIHSASADIET